MPTTNNNPQEVPQNGGAAMSENGNEVQQNNVGPISTAIEKITKLRAEHLPLIQEKEKLAQELTDALNIFEDWQRDIRTKQSDATLVDLRQKVSDLNQIANYDITALKDKLAKYKAQVERLRKRFERKNVQISLVGRARHGKSCILQAITGLNDDTIPTSSETDCTGAVSIIYNWDKQGEFEMDVDYYTPTEFIKAVNDKLDSFFGEGHADRVNSLDQIASLPQSAFNFSVPEQEGFYNDYVARFHQYVDCFSPNVRRHFDSTDNVVEYVAKYKIFKKEEDIPETYRRKNYEIERREQEVDDLETGEKKTVIDYKVHFANFVTIKKAVMSTHYPNPDTTKVVAVDTIGLGNALTSATDRDNMFKVLREDTDIAIFTYKIIPGSESQLPEFITDSLNEIFGELEGMFPEYWVSCFLNEYGSNSPQFIGRPSDYASYKNVVSYIHSRVAGTGFGPNAESMKLLTVCKTVNALDKNAVNSQFILPVLEQITRKLPEIDAAMAKAANDCGKKVFDEIHALCEKLAEIKSRVLELNPQREIQFITNFDALEYKYQLELLIEKLRRERDSGNSTISNDLREHLDKIDEAIPKTEEMQKTLRAANVFAKQAGVANIILNVYAKILKDMKAVSSKSISTIQLNAQNQVAEILFEYGLWDKLNLANANEGIQPVERLRLFTEQKLVMYPNLHQAIKSVLDFKMNIEGLLYSSCILRCEVLKDFPSIDTNMTQDEVISEVKSFLQKKVPSIKKELEFDFGIKKDALGPKKTNLSLKMPNLLVWCLVDTFYQELASKDCQNELQTFYREYQDTIWEDKVKEQTGLADLVKKYVMALQCFVEFDSEAKYLISITNKN